MQLIDPSFYKELKNIALSRTHAVLIEGVAGYSANYEANCLADLLQQSKSGEVQHIVKPEDKTVIGIEQIQALYRATRGRAVQSQAIWIIDDAHFLSEAASDAFLKLLEEPPTGVTFILSVDNVQNTLATIRSRCRIVRSRPFQTVGAQAYLVEKNVSAADQKQLLFLAVGSPDELVSLAENVQYRQARLTAAIQAKKLISGDNFEQIVFCNETAGNRIKALEVIELALRMLLAVSSQQAAQARYVQRINALSEAHRRIMANGNVRVQLLSAILAR